MANTLHCHVRMLGVVPCTKGFGFAVLEDGRRLLDWGVARLYSKSSDEFLARVDSLVRRYDIGVLAFEEADCGRRGPRAKRLLGALAASADLPVVARNAVSLRAAMDIVKVSTRYDLAITVAGWFPELQQHLPASRKPWQSEDQRMSLFVAAFVAFLSTDRSSILGRQNVARP